MEQINSWYSLTLGDGMWAPTLSAQIEKEFLAAFEKSDKPLDMGSSRGTNRRAGCIARSLPISLLRLRRLQRHLTPRRVKNHQALDWSC